MWEPTIMDAKYWVQFVGLFSSLILNSLLICLVATKAPKKMGTYKHLMCFFSLFSMVYALIDWVVKPFIHSHGASFSMIMVLKEGDNPNISFFLTASLAGCFGVTIYAIAISFIFRFFALERKNRLRYFEPRYLPIWFSIPMLGGLLWIVLCWTTMHPDEQFTEYLRESIRDNYNLSADNVIYTGAYFYRADEHGVLHWNVENTLGALGLNVLMAIPFVTILVYGTKSYTMIRKLHTLGACDYTKKLQWQLYKALVVQTLIPMVFLFVPIGILFTAPLFDLNIEKGSLLVTFFYSLYPAVDPIPIIFLIDDFRNALFDFFRCPTISCNRNQVSVITPEVVSLDVVTH